MTGPTKINPFAPLIDSGPDSCVVVSGDLIAIPGWHLAASPTVGGYVAKILRSGRSRLSRHEIATLQPIYEREKAAFDSGRLRM